MSPHSFTTLSSAFPHNHDDPTVDRRTITEAVSGQTIPQSRADFEHVLIQQGLLTPDHIRVVQQEETISGRHWLTLLDEAHVFAGSTALECLSQWTGLPCAPPDIRCTDLDLLKRWPHHVAVHHRCFPVAREENTLLAVAMDPFDLSARDALRRQFDETSEIQLMLMSEAPFFSALASSHASPDNDETSTNGVLEARRPYHLPERSTTESFVQFTLLSALRAGASDVHFEPEAHHARVRFRVDGMLELFHVVHREAWSSLCLHLKVRAGVNITNPRDAQDGRFRLDVEGQPYDCRLSTHPTVHGENIVVRLLDPYRAVDMRTLKIPANVQRQIENLLMRPQGILIVTGPTGCGKSSTLHALLRQLDGRSLNIMTLEDPVERVLPHARQTDVSHYGSFAGGVRSLLRQSPDVIMIGEIRDAETARLAFQAAMTGHKVLTTLHTDSVLRAFDRLHDLGVSRYDCTHSVAGLVGQRLVRCLCPQCKEPSPNAPEPEALAVGCSRCRYTGYQGRQPIFEVISMTPHLARALLSTPEGGASYPPLDWESVAYAEGYRPLQDAGMALVHEGVTSRAELSRHVGFDDALWMRPAPLAPSPHATLSKRRPSKRDSLRQPSLPSSHR